MANIDIVERADSFLLITDRHGRYAVVEARNGHVYSLHGHGRREAPWGEDGMVRVVGEDGWFDEASARETLARVRDGGEDYARIIW